MQLLQQQQTDRQSQADEQVARALQDEFSRECGGSSWAQNAPLAPGSGVQEETGHGSYPALDKDAGPQKRKDKKAVLAPENSRGGPAWAAEATNAVVQRGGGRDAHRGAVGSGRKVPTASTNLQDPAKPARK